MAKKWLDSIEKQRRRIDLKERYRHTYRHTYIQAGRRLDSAPSANVVAIATGVGPKTLYMVPLNRPSPKTP